MDFELPKDFKELLESLNENGVKYLLVGGYAVGLHGYGRSTNDIDIFIASDQDNAEKLVKALSEFGLADDAPDPEIFTAKDSLVVMGVEPMAVDILNYLSGVDFNSAYERRELVQAGGIEISLISLEDLLKNKELVARPKDLMDIDYFKKLGKYS